MLRGTKSLLRLPTRALTTSASAPSAVSFHRLSTSHDILRQLRPALPQGLSVVRRTQYSSKPFIPPSEIKKQEKETAQRKLEPHPETVSSTSTTRALFEPDPEQPEGTKVTKKDQDEVLGSLKDDINTVVETVALGAVPRSWYRLGLAGTVPYVFTSLSTVYLSWNLNTQWPTDNNFLNSFMVSNETASNLLHLLEPIQLGYGAVIISFLGAIHWGLELGEKKYSKPRTSFRYAMGVAAPAIAWPTMILPVEWALTSQFAAFMGLYFADARATTRGWAPAWYGTYRFVLTAIVGGAIFVSLIGRFKVGEEGKALSTEGLKETLKKSTVNAEPYTNWAKKEDEEKEKIKKEKEEKEKRKKEEERKKHEAEQKLKEKEKGDGKKEKKDSKEKKD